MKPRNPLEIRDPIYGPISVLPEEIKIIDSAYVQRLRGIKQTGFAELAFPGSTHNRYSHSLGAFHLAGRAFDQVFQDFNFRDLEEKVKFRFLLRLAALLHDCGHGPLSHAIEQAMPSRSEIIENTSGSATHEDYTEAIIMRSSLTEILKSTFGDHTPLALVSLVRNKNRVPDYFNAGDARVSIFPLLSSLISGEIDVDRMDYMARDSLYCGIPYGHFDRDWIFSNLSFVVKERSAYLALDSRALYAFEDFLLSRYHLYLMVYFHHKSVIYDEMLYQFLLTDENETRLPSSIEEYLQVDDHWLWSRLKASKNPWARRIIEQKPYRMLLEIHSDRSAEGKAYADETEQKLKAERIPYFRSSSTGLLSKYVSSHQPQRNPIYLLYRDQRFISNHRPGIDSELLSEATELYHRYQKKKIIDRIFAEKKLS